MIFKRQNNMTLKKRNNIDNKKELKVNRTIKKLLLKRIDGTYFKSYNDFISIKLENKEYDLFNNEYEDLINNDIIVIDYKTKNNIELLCLKTDINSLLMSMIEY